MAEQLMNALLLGASYTLAAIGYSLFFGVADTVIFCAGDIAIFGSFSVLLLYALAVALGLFASLPAWLAALMVILGGAILCALLSLLAQWAAVKPFERAPALMPLLSTVAFGVLIREALGLFYPQGRNPQVFPTLLPKGALLGVSVLSYRNLIILGVTLLLLTALFWLVTRTRIGLSMQALSQNREAALMIGVNPGLVATFTFVLAGVLLGIGGFLIGSYYSIVRFDMGAMYGLKGFSAAVVGGLGNIYGAIVGSMLIAFVEVFVSGYVPGGTAYASVFAFVVVVLFMVFKPEGILGEKIVQKV
ncbi:MAG: branched-chain amino acid ABC transporter permease [Actinobacteria bacterium]|nr:branched-chain amino acid ABC transporter permease [Actinomycetota bacterium]